MSFYTSKNPCPCESGRDYLFCCGNVENRIFELGELNQQGQCNAELSRPMQEALMRFNREPSLFPISLDTLSNKAVLSKMSPFWFSESVFLDQDRILGKCRLQCNLQWLKLQADHIVYQPTNYIFHTAFCGSTIISKALENIYQSLVLREPDILGSLVQFKHANMDSELLETWYKRITALLSRRFEPESSAA